MVRVRARVAARVMTVRGLLVRFASAGGAVVVLSLVTPAEFGLLAVVRSLTTIVEQGTELGLVWPLLRQRDEPTREEYGALAGAQVLLLMAVLAIAAVWLPAETRWWLLAVVTAMFTITLGTGARIRLERELRYSRIAIAEVSGLLLHTTVLIAFLMAGKFRIGVFVAQIAITLYLNCFLYASSPGPLPTLHVSRLLRMVKSSAGYTMAFLVMVAREQAPALIVAALFGLQAAGTWAFAARLGKFLQFTYEGFARVGVPAAARLAPDRSALRQLAAESLTGAALGAIPAAAIVVFGLPAVPLIWPQWTTAVPLAQIYVPSEAIAGVMAAALGPIALALFGWRAVLIEHAVPLLIACTSFVFLWYLGLNALEDAAIAVQIGAVAALIAITDAKVRPAWNREMTRIGMAVASGLAVYVVGRFVGLQPAIIAVAASAILAAWLWRPWMDYMGVGR